jgi:hypothetical protein
MFNKAIFILTAFYFLAGNILLPQGDFAALTELPDMYRHCQTTEDPDMDVIDFITGHLLNLDDGAEDKNDIDEHELPHNPLPFHSASSPTFYCINQHQIISFETPSTIVLIRSAYKSPYCSRINTHKIFQPPRV